MTDKELLELAAKAAGIEIKGWYGANEDCGPWAMHIRNQKHVGWNPLTNDGDALRLAVKLDIFNTRSKGYEWPQIDFFESDGEDPYAATRRAIVMAAAEIGKGMV